TPRRKEASACAPAPCSAAPPNFSDPSHSRRILPFERAIFPRIAPLFIEASRVGHTPSDPARLSDVVRRARAYAWIHRRIPLPRSRQKRRPGGNNRPLRPRSDDQSGAQQTPEGEADPRAANAGLAAAVLREAERCSREAGQGELRGGLADEGRGNLPR